MNEEEKKIGAIADKWFKDPNTPRKSIKCPICKDAYFIIEHKLEKNSNDWTLEGKCPRCGRSFQWTKTQDKARRPEDISPYPEGVAV